MSKKFKSLMRKKIFILILIIGFSPIAYSYQEQFEVAIENPNFDDDGIFLVASGWNSFGGTKWEGYWRDEENNFAQGVSDILPGGSCGVYQQVTGVLTGAIYTVTAWAKRTGSKFILYAGIRNDNQTEWTGAHWGTGSNANEWTQISASTIQAASTTTISIYLRAWNSHTEFKLDDWGYFDQVKLYGEFTLPLTATPTPTIYSTPTITPTPEPTKTFTPTLVFTPTKPCIKGDVTCDSGITPGDALLVFLLYLDEVTLTGEETCQVRCAADVNEDGEVTPGDALCIFLRYLGQAC